MQSTSLTPEEQERLRALYSYEILDTEPEQVFDDLIKLASFISGSPIAMISLVDEDRQWFKARVGIEAQETLRSESFCSHAIQQRDVFIVPDAQSDERFRNLSLVTDDTKIRFYAGTPLINPDGQALGTICVMDPEPHTLSAEQIEALRILGNEVISRLELRQRNRQLAQLMDERDALNRSLESNVRILHSALEAMIDGVLLADTLGTVIYANQNISKIWRLPSDLLEPGKHEALGAWIMHMLVDDDVVLDHMHMLMTNQFISDAGLLRCKDGRTIEYSTQPHMLSDTAIGRVWCFRDVTERVEAESEQVRLQQAAFDAQLTLVRELSTPLIPISHNTLLMPIIGSIDEERAEQIVQTLATGLHEYKATTVIVDVVGARAVGGEAARAFVRAAQMVRLLGAQMMITGISPEMAQTFVSLGVELPGLQVCTSLQEGLRRVMMQAAR
jgi:anti-anti-sigma regulatory factor/PAS domain-containing protein